MTDEVFVATKDSPLAPVIEAAHKNGHRIGFCLNYGGPAPAWHVKPGDYRLNGSRDALMVHDVKIDKRGAAPDEMTDSVYAIPLTSIGWVRVFND